MDEHEKLNELVQKLLKAGRYEDAERLIAVIKQQKALLAERKKMEEQLAAMPPSKYLELLKASMKLSDKLLMLFSKVTDDDLELELINTFNAYISTNNEMGTEFLTQLELRKMDELEQQIKKDE